MARSRAGSLSRGRSRASSGGPGRAASWAPSASSQQTNVRRVKRPASEWHSDGSQRRLTISSRQFGRQPSQPPSRSSTGDAAANGFFVTPDRRQIGSVAPAINHDDSDESLNHIIMALDIKERGAVGCAYYVAREERLFCMEDYPRGGLETMDKRKIVWQCAEMTTDDRSKSRHSAHHRITFDTS
jgi:DNA mismatch repair protein MSH5